MPLLSAPERRKKESMYRLYYSPGACSLAVHAVLNYLGVPFELERVSIPEGANRSPEYLKLNPRGQVPLLIEDGRTMRESAAMMIHLLEKHDGGLLPKSGDARAEAMEWLMFCNSGLHQAYSTFFMYSRVLKDEAMREEVCRVACKRIQKLWDDVEEHLRDKPYLCGAKPTAADLLMTVIANWSGLLKPEIQLGDNLKKLCGRVIREPYMAKALETEGITYRQAA